MNEYSQCSLMKDSGMSETSARMLLVLALTILVDVSTASVEFQKFTKVANLTLHHVTTNTTVLSLVQCCRYCDNNDDCLAVNYDQKQRLCQLNSKSPEDAAASRTVSNIFDVYYKEVIPSASTCESNWQLYMGHCYLYSRLAKGWTASESHCISLGANLVDIETVAENSFVVGIAISAGATVEEIWIGLADIWSGTNLAWSTGAAVDYRNYLPGEPDNDLGSENCVQLGLQSQSWSDKNCQSSKPSVCKKKLI